MTNSNPHHPFVLTVLQHVSTDRLERAVNAFADGSMIVKTGVLTIPRSKNGEARHIPMNDRAVDILRSLPSRMKSPYVFPSETGESPLNANNFINRVWNPARKKASLADLHWHDLRHTFASRLTMAGVDLRTVQELMGHKTITMTLRYSHLSPTHQREAVQRLIQEPTATRTAISHNVA